MLNDGKRTNQKHKFNMSHRNDTRQYNGRAAEVWCNEETDDIEIAIPGSSWVDFGPSTFSPTSSNRHKNAKQNMNEKVAVNLAGLRAISSLQHPSPTCADNDKGIELPLEKSYPSDRTISSTSSSDEDDVFYSDTRYKQPACCCTRRWILLLCLLIVLICASFSAGLFITNASKKSSAGTNDSQFVDDSDTNSNESDESTDTNQDTKNTKPPHDTLGQATESLTDSKDDGIFEPVDKEPEETTGNPTSGEPTPSNEQSAPTSMPAPTFTPSSAPTYDGQIPPIFIFNPPDTSSCVPIDETLNEGDYMMNPLDCNSNLQSEPCEPWSSMFSDNTTYTNEITIPCGKCVIMDHLEPYLTLFGGLDIRGKLIFTDGYRLTMETPYILVQGELQMDSTKLVDGQVDVKFLITGTSDVNFVPADSNSEVCSGGCGVGKKPIVVAGGKLSISGLKADTPTWLPLYDVIDGEAETATGLIVSSEIQGKWGVGAEVLVTSHTLNFDDGQLRTISAIYQHSKEGYMVIELQSPILRPSTVVDNPDFAVEVALLSRNILFEGAKDDSNIRHGAHLIVFGTHTIPQLLEGVELKNFGQQGILGRYPVHFHLSQNVCGAVVAKNVIRESNQRCVVVHGTHNVLVSENIAYDTAGHCFMTEDGIEEGNIFKQNLGALTKKVIDLIPNNGLNGRESDDLPSTFWASSASNSWEGNVAAGSESSGFWFELKRRVRGQSNAVSPNLNPQKVSLKSFKDNVAHSNGDHGLRTYPSGYVPDEQAIFYNMRSFRNYQEGVFFHNSRNLALVGGVFADNRIQIDLDRAENMLLRDLEIIGYTSEYRQLVESEFQAAPDRCPNHIQLVGIDMHTFTRNDHTAPWKDYGAEIFNVNITGFVDTGCGRGALSLNLEDEVRTKSFDYFITLENVDVEPEANWVDFCPAENAGVIDIFMIDRDSSLKPSTSLFEEVSSLVSMTQHMTAFIDAGKCTDVAERCYKYCEDTCLRAVTYNVNPAETENYKLRVCDKSNATTCIEVSDYYYYQSNTMEDTISLKDRIFTVALPRGDYEAVFLDENNNEVWPSYVEEKYHQVQCSNALEDGSVTLRIPTLATGECENLIKNGDAEASTQHHKYWLHRSDGIQLKMGEGINGSYAFSDITRTTSTMDTLVQYLDTRCLDFQVGSRYEIKAWVKLKDEGGSIYQCDIDNEICPEVSLWTRYPSGDDVVKKSFPTAKATEYSSLIDGYFLIHGELEITQDMADATAVWFSVRRGRKDVYNMYVDNVSMERINTNSCDELIENGEFASGDSRYWDKYTGDSLAMTTPGASGIGDYALKSFKGSAKQLIRPGCIQEGERYVMMSKFKLMVGDFAQSCDGDSSGSSKCPEMVWRTKSYPNPKPIFTDHRAKAIGIPTANAWNTLYGVFTADVSDATPQEIRVTYDNLVGAPDLLVDDVSVRKVPIDCTGMDLSVYLQASVDGICK